VVVGSIVVKNVFYVFYFSIKNMFFNVFYSVYVFLIFKNIYNILTWPVTCLFVNLFFHWIANKPTKSFCLCPTFIISVHVYIGNTGNLTFCSL